MHFTIPLKERIFTNSVISTSSPRNRAIPRKGLISEKKDYYCLKKTPNRPNNKFESKKETPLITSTLQHFVYLNKTTQHTG